MADESGEDFFSFEDMNDRTKANDWEAEWKGLPSYNNQDAPPPVIRVMFKFRSQEDFDTFHDLIKKHLYDGQKVFDGTQREDKKSAWWPLGERPSAFVYEDEA